MKSTHFVTCMLMAIKGTVQVLVQASFLFPVMTPCSRIIMFGYLSNAGYIISSETFIQLVFNQYLSRYHAGNKIVIIIVVAVASLVAFITII